MTSDRPRPTRACDCLNWCGDDPAVRAGQARPCERMQKDIDDAARDRAELARLHADAQKVATWLTGGADPQAIPREQIAAAVAFVITKTKHAT